MNVSKPRQLFLQYMRIGEALVLDIVAKTHADMITHVLVHPLYSMFISSPQMSQVKTRKG